MDRLALRDDLSFDRFHPPRLSRFWVWATRPLRRAMARWQHRVDRLELTGADHLTAILKRGRSVLIAANPADRAWVRSGSGPRAGRSQAVFVVLTASPS